MTETIRPEINKPKTVAICDTQPITAEGLKTLLSTCPDLEFCDTIDSLELASTLLRRKAPDILLIDKRLAMHAVLDWLNDLKLSEAAPAIVVWGVSMTEAEALRL